MAMLQKHAVSATVFFAVLQLPIHGVFWRYLCHAVLFRFRNQHHCWIQRILLRRTLGSTVDEMNFRDSSDLRFPVWGCWYLVAWNPKGIPSFPSVPLVCRKTYPVGCCLPWTNRGQTESTNVYIPCNSSYPTPPNFIQIGRHLGKWRPIKNVFLTYNTGRPCLWKSLFTITGSNIYIYIYRMIEKNN